MNKKIILILFISLSIIMCTAVSAENLTTTDSGVVNGGLYSNAVQKTPYNEQNSGDNQETVSFNITKKEAKTTGSSNTQTSSSSQTTQHIKNISSAKLHTMIYVQNTNNRISSYVNVSLDGDNDGTYEVELENNRLLNITSSKDGEVYRLNENITRVYSDYLLSYDIAKYIKADTINVKVHAVSAAGDSDSKIKYVGLAAAYNVEDSQSDKEVHYWINSGHSWTDETSETTFNTNYDIEGIDGANVTLTQVSTASSAAETYLNGHEINPVEPVPGTYFAQNIYDVAEFYETESNEMEFIAGNGIYGASYKTTLATLEVEVPKANSGNEDESANVTVSDVRVTSNNNRVLLALLNNTIRVSMVNTGSVIDQANVTLNIGDYSQTKEISSLGNTTQNVVFDYYPLTNATTEMSVDIDYLNGTTERIYNNTTIIYYNGYMGKSFTGGENFTVKRVYEGFNNIVIIQTNEYKSASWQDFNVTVDSSEYGIVDADKVVDVLYYQGYNWDYGYVLDTLELKLNNETLNHIAFYNDTKGFATWNFPSGLLVYNVTDTFKVNDTNTIEFIRHDSPQLALYTGYFVVIYENSNKYRNIQITEECDLLNTEDSGYGANSTTAVSYAPYGGFSKELYNSTQLYVITGAANWDDGSLVYFNDQTLASMAENWNATSQESFSLFNISDISEDENLVTMQSINDNFVVYSTILIVNYDYPRFSVSKVDVPASKGDLLVETDNNVTVKLLNDGAKTTANITITVDDTTEEVVLEDFEGETTLNVSYNPDTTGQKAVKVEVTYENGTTETLYEGTLNAYYNGYRGKSFTNGNNFTTKREYVGQNTLILEQYDYYNWNANPTATYDATNLEADKIVDALYYQGYNWDKYLNFKLTVNDQDAPIIANYSDTKGFGTYNYPSGMVVFNITAQFKAGQTNTITPVQLENNSNILYGGILVIIYANNTNVTNILINEETDLLNPEASGLTTNDYTKAYSIYENLDTTPINTTLYTITAAADKAGESKIIFNDAEYGSMADNYNSVSKLSIVTSDITNVAEGTNNVTLHSLSDNLVVFATVLVQTYEQQPNITVTKVDVPASKGDLLVETDNGVAITMLNDGGVASGTLSVTIGDTTESAPLEEFTGQLVANVNYNPATTGEKAVKVEVTYENGTTETLYEGTLNAYYNGYRGKSFTAQENFTTKREYVGQNTLILEQYDYYNWNANPTATYDATNLEADKIVDALYYQGYNWDKFLNFKLTVNGEDAPIIANYSDTKGFGTYNYPSGMVVFNITAQFKAGQTNTITPVQLENNSNILYGGIMVIIYANNTNVTNILINEETDLLNPEASGLTTNDYTKAYSIYENLDTTPVTTTLYTITAAADKTDGSKIIFNDAEYGSMADNYNSVSKLSIVTSDITNVAEGTNNVTLHSLSDNLVVFATVLVQTYEQQPNITVTKVDVPASKGDLLVETENNITVKISNDGGLATGTLTVTIDDVTESLELEDFEGETSLDIKYNPSTPGEKNIKVDVTYEDGTTESVYESTLSAYYNGYRGKSFTAQENFTTQRSYAGQNTLILEQYDYYNWNATSTATFDATELKSHLIIDALYYQGYNWDKYLNFGLTVNGEDAPVIASYSDAKGFGTYNYPSGLVVFNLTGLLQAGQVNTITPVQLENNSNILYGGILVVIYANNTNYTNIFINEGSDLLNPEASGLTSNDYTKAYSIYDDVKVMPNTTLYTITAAADKAGESKIIFNDAEYGCMADNYNSVSKLSVVESEITNAVEGTNTVTLHSTGDNLFVMSTILVTSLEREAQETSVVIEPITTQIGETINLTVSVTAGDDVVDEGKVYFKVNGRVLRDESGRILFAQVNDGVAVLENFTVPDNWNNDTRIVAGFVGNKYLLSSNSEVITPVIIASEDEPSIVVENVTSGVDEDVTIRVNVNNIDDGKIIMKINGKTVKDLSTGKLYVKVVDGVAEVTYHVPKTMKAGEYDIKVVYTKGNIKLEETGTLTVEN